MEKPPLSGGLSVQWIGLGMTAGEGFMVRPRMPRGELSFFMSLIVRV